MVQLLFQLKYIWRQILYFATLFVPIVPSWASVRLSPQLNSWQSETYWILMSRLLKNLIIENLGPGWSKSWGHIRVEGSWDLDHSKFGFFHSMLLEWPMLCFPEFTLSADTRCSLGTPLHSLWSRGDDSSTNLLYDGTWPSYLGLREWLDQNPRIQKRELNPRFHGTLAGLKH